MTTPRLLAAALTAVLGLSLAACGSDDDGAPAASPSAVDLAPTDDASSSTPPATTTGDPDEVTDPDLRAELEKIALDEVGNGRVSEIEHSDDRDHAYEVEVEVGGDDDVTVEIAEDMSVVRVDR